MNKVDAEIRDTIIERIARRAIEESEKKEASQLDKRILIAMTAAYQAYEAGYMQACYILQYGKK